MVADISSDVGFVLPDFNSFRIASAIILLFIFSVGTSHTISTAEYNVRADVGLLTTGTGLGAGTGAGVYFFTKAGAGFANGNIL